MTSDQQPPAANVDVLGADFWPVAEESEFNALQIVPATGPVIEVLGYLDAIPNHRLVGTVPNTLRRATETLAHFDLDRRLQSSAVESGDMDRAVAALRELREALQGEGEDLGLEASKLESYLADPPGLLSDLRKTVGRFLYQKLDADYDDVATFSIILFDDLSHDGALSESLRNERSAWRKALTPPARGAPDLHLAVVPPPSAVDGVRYLAADLGCEDKMPCVLFLGNKPDFSAASAGFATSWSARTLRKAPPAYPEQLADIYNTVYARGALKPGTAGAAFADKAFTVLKRVVNPWGVLRLLAGAVGGAKLVETVEAVLRDDVKK